MASASPSSLNLCHFALLTAFLCHTSLLTGGEVGELGYILCMFQSFSCLRASTHAVPPPETFSSYHLLHSFSTFECWVRTFLRLLSPTWYLLHLRFSSLGDARPVIYSFTRSGPVSSMDSEFQEVWDVSTLHVFSSTQVRHLAHS